METEKYSVSMACGKIYSDQAKYSCKRGYSLSGGSLQTTCQASGWTNGPPMCTMVGCGPPTTPINGQVTFTSTNENDIASYVCDIGHNSTAALTTKCLSSKTWDTPAPTCLRLECGPLMDPEFGTVNTSEGLQYEDVATYTCDEGYELIGSNRTVCQANATWSDAVIECVLVDCGIPMTPVFGAVNYTNTTYMSVAAYECAEGFMVSGTFISSCLSSGVWNDSIACLPVDCGEADGTPYSVKVFPNGTTFPNYAAYKCEVGFTMNGSDTRYCQSNGTWNGTAPTCQMVECGFLPEIPFGDVYYHQSRSYLHNVTYYCDYGYTLNGSTQRTCQMNNVWSDDHPTCDLINCTELLSLDNGYVIFSNGSIYLSEAIHTCKYGFRLYGDIVRTCLADQQWSGMSPSCTLIDCYMPSTPTNGMLNTTGTNVDDEATFACIDGYNLTGSLTQTCLSNGSWSLTTPKCVLIDCGTLHNPANGKVVFQHETTFYEDQARFNCNTGFNLSSVTNYLTCTSTGWSADPPTCKPIGNVIKGHTKFNYIPDSYSS